MSFESVSELRNVLHAKAHGTFKIERVAVSPAYPYWARMLVFVVIVHCLSALTGPIDARYQYILTLRLPLWTP
jgi:hypothetical protein